MEIGPLQLLEEKITLFTFKLETQAERGGANLLGNTHLYV